MHSMIAPRLISDGEWFSLIAAGNTLVGFCNTGLRQLAENFRVQTGVLRRLPRKYPSRTAFRLQVPDNRSHELHNPLHV